MIHFMKEAAAPCHTLSNAFSTSRNTEAVCSLLLILIVIVVSTTKLLFDSFYTENLFPENNMLHSESKIKIKTVMIPRILYLERWFIFFSNCVIIIWYRNLGVQLELQIFFCIRSNLIWSTF